MHHGRIFNTAGDAILAEFTSAVEAVRCATDIQAALRTRNDQLAPYRQVKFRMGINLGDVMIHGQDLMGDGVNVAARLQTAAEPGGICISGSVHDQIVNKLSLSFQSLGEIKFQEHPAAGPDVFDNRGRGWRDSALYQISWDQFCGEMDRCRYRVAVGGRRLLGLYRQPAEQNTTDARNRHIRSLRSSGPAGETCRVVRPR